jgi:hypothetical protein
VASKDFHQDDCYCGLAALNLVFALESRTAKPLLSTARRADLQGVLFECEKSHAVTFLAAPRLRAQRNQWLKSKVRNQQAKERPRHLASSLFGGTNEAINCI